MNSPEELNRRFGLDRELAFDAGPGGLTVARIANDHASATIALQGAHVLAWQPRGEEPVIWLSPAAKFAPGTSVRGGVPVCWPWFSAHVTESAFPAHGFACTVPWSVAATERRPDGSTRIAFRLEPNDATRAQWPHATPVETVVTVAKALEVALVTRNAGTSAVTIGEALHTYFAISDITGRECAIEDPDLRRRIRISATGSRSTVVWNPWVEKAKKMGDFGKDGWMRMLCVETVNAAEDVITIRLRPAASTAFRPPTPSRNCRSGFSRDPSSVETFRG